MDIIRIGVLSAIIGALLAACAPVRTAVDHPSPGEGGMFDLDELTDPRLVHSDALGTIGVLRPIGGAVFLDSAVVRSVSPISNGAHLRTGANSFARVEFAAQRAHPCEIGILNLFTGNMYSESGHCSQRVETPHALIRVQPGGMAFEVRVDAAQTRIIVLRGAIGVRSRTGPGTDIQVRANQEIVVGRSGTSAPGPTRSKPDWRRRIVLPDPGPGPMRDLEKEKAAYCERYGQEAVADNNANISQRCNFTGAAWQSNYGAHYNWCITGDNWQKLAAKEEEARKTRLAQCRQPIPDGGNHEKEKAAYCARYGQAAVADNNANISQRCNFTGAAWQSNYGAHYNWCMTGDNWQKLAAKEEEARKTRLAQCRQPIPDGGKHEKEKAAYCARYGKAAVADNNANIKERCNFTGAAWQSNYGAHYNWCMTGDNWQKFAAKEEEARKTRLAQCRQPIYLR